MSKTSRHEFTDLTKREIAKRAGYKCSYPGCPVWTVGPTTDGTRSMNIGTAAHIAAAAPGGPRYDSTMSRDERRSANNGIWMCRNHGTAIDAPDATYTTDLLHKWRRQAYEDARRRMLSEHVIPWPDDSDSSTAFVALRDAARVDFAVFQRTTGWPSAVIDVTVRLDDMTAPSPSTVLAGALMSLGNLILVAPPGIGKTITLLRTAERLDEEGGAPLVVSLADWAVGRRPLLSSILDRPAFRAVSEDLFRSAATRPGVVLLLDGWNELDLPSRNRVRVEVDRLRAELPELGLMVATRRQAMDVPFTGTLVELLPLDDSQQMALAEAQRGDAGKALLDHAWRTPGLRALTAIPLYLSALLSMPEGSDLPATREEALCLFVDHHEKDPSRDKHLHCALQGFQGAYLEALAASMTDAATTAIGDADARRAVSVASAALMEDGQITARPQPNDVLDVLVGHHILVRADGAAGGVGFQHQQFQEWYASHEVERRILAAASDPDARKALMAAVLDRPAWEEAILFAVERLSRRDAAACGACANAILAAFEVDPMLAAEMIARATEPVWAGMASEIDDRVRRWHEPGEVDRAVRFMLTTGRPEFLDAVWPLITHKDEQVSLHALRSCARFRPTVLGVEPTARIAALPAGVRATLLCEIAENSGIDGLDLARDVAARDPEPGVRADVARLLVYRRADRHVAAVLEGAADEVFDRLHNDDLEDEIDDEVVRHRLAEARRRWAAREGPSPARLRTLVLSSDSSDHGPLVGEILDGLDAYAPRERIDYHLLSEAYERYPDVTVASILRRLREGRPLLHGSGDVLVRANIVLEDDDLARIASNACGRFDQAAIAAAGVLGPVATGQLLDAYLEMERRREALERHDEAFSDRCHALLDCLRVVPGSSLVAAATARGRDGDIQDLARLADLIGSHVRDRQEATPSFDSDAACQIHDLVHGWGERMLAAEDAERKHKASLAYMARRVPAITLLPILQRLLDDNLERFRVFREEARAAGWRGGGAVQEARMPMMDGYRAAFSAIVSPETAALMRSYLTDEHFGPYAARVLVDHWRSMREMSQEGTRPWGPTIAPLPDRREAYETDPDATSAEAEAIFDAVGPLLDECGALEGRTALAVELGVIGAYLPHGRRDGLLRRLLDVAPRSKQAALLTRLVLGGKHVALADVEAGIAQTYEAADGNPWILSEGGGFELKSWIDLLPFTDRASDLPRVIASLHSEHRTPRFLETLLENLPHASTGSAEEALFGLADGDPRFYQDDRWRRAAVRLEAPSAARWLLDRMADGAFDGERSSSWWLARDFASAMDADPDVRDHAYDLLRADPPCPGFPAIAASVAEAPDDEGLLLLVDLERTHGLNALHSLVVERAVSRHVPLDGAHGVYQVVPVPCGRLRAELLTRTTGGGSGDAAARVLKWIDEFRDEHGLLDADRRHPDLASGRSWPPIWVPTRA